MYVCKHCKKTSLEYKGQCPNTACGKWNGLEEKDPSEIIVPDREVDQDETRARPITEIASIVDKRFTTGIGELDRVLGSSGDVSGIVYPSIVLVAGDPGIGKSTALLQVALNVARDEGPVIYATGEESAEALSARAQRIGAKHERLLVQATNHLEHIDADVKRFRPRLLIVDSTQTVGRMDIAGEPGSIAQVRGLPMYLRPIGKTKGQEMAVVIVGHVNKEGAAAGPKTLEHLVDATLYFEGEKGKPMRFIRSAKNRFNSTEDVGVLQMSDRGLVDVLNPSAHFLAQRRAEEPGTVITSMCSGINNRRALLVEVQVLFGTTELPRLDVSASGLNKARVVMMCAVLGRKAGLKIDNLPLYAQAVGGLDVDERAADLTIAVAIASAARSQPVRSDMIAFGEVGFMGELRDTPQAQLRLKEAVTMGFKKALVPPFKHLEPVDGIELLRAETLSEAIEMALV